jgi:L,D-transpeptidase YcbB
MATISRRFTRTERAARTCIIAHLALAGVLSLTLSLGTPAAAQSAAEEMLRARVETLALDQRLDNVVIADAGFLIGFYERRQFRPAWEDATKLAALLAALRGSVRHGLSPADYHVDEIALAYARRTEATALERANLDILATDGLARYAFHLRFGKVNPEELEPTWNLSRSLTGIDPFAALERLLAASDLPAALDAFAPHDPRYGELIRALAQHRELARAGGWPAVPAGETLRAGMRSPRVSVLRERLAVTDDLVSDARAEPSELFDDALDAAVRAFQTRHGLEADGVVGPRSLAALNVPVEARIEQLRVNLERARWIFRDLEDRYIITNIARFQTTLIENGVAVWRSRSVVGRPYRQTPVFRARMTYLVFNPTWTVPPGILRQDLLPDIRRDLATLGQRNMVVLDTAGRVVDPATVDWSGVRGFPFVVRQEPGPNNALGRVKFMFPNQYHVYMHDTPTRDLFERADRTFSSGCIRLEHPLELARILLAETGEWSEAVIDRTLADGRPRTVTLPRPLTVLLIYATAVPENGRILFLSDVYGRDARVLAALDDEFTFSPPAGYEEALLMAPLADLAGG